MIKNYNHEVEAIQYTGVNRDEIKEFLGECEHYYEGENLVIPFEDGGEVEVNPADYIIKELSGHVYALEPIKFEEDYREKELCEFSPDNDEWKRNRSFSTASNWLKQGAKVARKEWKEMETYIYYDEKTGKTIYTNGLTETEWIPTSSDILENDWEIYEGK